MSTAAVSSSSIYQELQTYFQQRSGDIQQLGQALQEGDLTGAQQEYQTLQALGQGGPFANGDVFKVSQREQDFEAIGQALQTGDLAGAQQAFTELENTFHHSSQTTPPAEVVVVNLGGSASASAAGSAPSASASGESTQQPDSAAGSSPAAGNPEIVLNLGTASAGEQITIGVNNTGDGTEQVTVGVADAQNQNLEQIVLNLSQNSNEQIVLNFLNSSASSPAQGTSINTTA